MKIRAILLTLLIAAQTAWLAWLYYSADSELATAPRIRVNAQDPCGLIVYPDPQVRNQHPEINNRVSYRIDFTTWRTYCAMRSTRPLHLSMEIALRQNHAPLATQLFINDLPLAEALEAMKKGVIPQATETQNHSQDNETQGH